MSCPFSAHPSDTQSNGTRQSHTPLAGENTGIRATSAQGVTPISYHDYLQLDKLLSCQQRRSETYGNPAHEEMLFITIHQGYEIWFKQIMFELESIIQLFSEEITMADETSMLKISQRLSRVVLILEMCVKQFGVLMTMTPMDFASFRDYLVPASGFQSVQFRVFENRLGLHPKQRIKYHAQDYKAQFDKEHLKIVEDSENKTSLLQCIEGWLERNPVLESSWWDMITENMRIYYHATRMEAEGMEDEAAKKEMLATCTINENTFQQLTDVELYADLLKRGVRRISQRALRSAFMIFLLRDKPRFQVPYKILSTLCDIDSELTEWRHKHAGLVQRMIGTKMGTGGSSGYLYLRSTVSDRYKVFLDIAILSTYLVPADCIPTLDEANERLVSNSSKSTSPRPSEEDDEGPKTKKQKM
eukprot:m.258106 g.258106  ORF g.258106 m.258106 type:complete len:416 (-) comp36143_c0_seq1:236-1483(-)